MFFRSYDNRKYHKYIKSSAVQLLHQRTMKNLGQTDISVLNTNAVASFHWWPITEKGSSLNAFAYFQAIVICVPFETQLYWCSCGLNLPFEFDWIFFPIAVATFTSEARSFDVPVGEISSYFSDSESRSRLSIKKIMWQFWTFDTGISSKDEAMIDVILKVDLLIWQSLHHLYNIIIAINITIYLFITIISFIMFDHITLNS